jgi:membrane-associated phospholipid phosphatase
MIGFLPSVAVPGGRCALGLLCCVLFALGLPVCAGGQSLQAGEQGVQPTPPTGRWVPSFRTMGQDAVDIVEAPFELTPSERLLVLGASGLVMSTAAALDRPAYRYTSVQSGAVARTTGPLAAPGRWYDRVGPDRFALGTAGLLAAGGLAMQRRSWTRTSVRVVEALVYTKLVTGLAKSVINRSRPFVGGGPLAADPGGFSGAHGKLSMPSGHTARAFAVASVLAHRADRWYVSVPAYGLAASVGMERVRSGDHWLTDIMVGGTLGYLIGRSLAASPAAGPDQVTYTPILGTDRVGLSVRF